MLVEPDVFSAETTWKYTRDDIVHVDVGPGCVVLHRSAASIAASRTRTYDAPLSAMAATGAAAAAESPEESTNDKSLWEIEAEAMELQMDAVGAALDFKRSAASVECYWDEAREDDDAFEVFWLPFFFCFFFPAPIN